MNNDIKIPSKNSSISYSGKVEIRRTRGNKVVKTINVKNEGTSELFRLLACALAGYDVSGVAPNYIELFSGDSLDDTEMKSSCVVRVPANNRKVIPDDAGYSVVLDFHVPYNQITSSANILKLYSDTKNKNPLARVFLGELEDPNAAESIIINDSTSNALITWTLNLQNGVTDINGGNN